MTLPTTLQPEAFVSWDGSGAFDGPYDAVIRDVAADPGITISEGRDGGQQLSPSRINDGGMELLNDSGAYSQERADSPVYQRVEPTKPVLYRAVHGEEGVYDEDADYDEPLYYDGAYTSQLGRQMIDEIDERSSIGDRRVRLDTIGYETVLTRAPVTVDVMVAPLVSDCFAALLDAVDWPADKRRIATSDTRLAYWWCDERIPWTAMLELQASEGPGTFGVDRDGIFYFENRLYRGTAEHAQISQATLADTPGSGLYFKNLKPLSPFKNLFNRATYTIKTRTLASSDVIWTYGANVALTSGQSVTLIARPTDGNPFQNAITPSSPTDYAVSGGTVSVSLAADSGLVAFVTITATSGTPTVSALQLRAQSLTVVGETTIQNGIDASPSIARYSPIPGQDIPITLQVRGWPEIDAANAEGVCDAWVLRQMWPRALVTFEVENADGDHVEWMLKARISDRLTLIHAHTGLSADVWVNQGHITIAGAGGRTVAYVVGAEKCDTLTGFRWDVDEWDDPASLWGV